MKADGDAVFAFLDLRRTMQPQDFLVAFKVGCRHKQINRMARRQERQSGGGLRHGIKRLGQ